MTPQTEFPFWSKRGTIQGRFERYHRAHPEIYRLLVKFALQVKARGFRKYSVSAIWNRMRWHVEIESDSHDGGYKLNNDFISRYARLLNKDPRLLGFFETRKLRAP